MSLEPLIDSHYGALVEFLRLFQDSIENRGVVLQEYRKMGHWRLLFPCAFARKLGYKYLLQVDTDSDVMEELTFNILDVMEDGNLDIAARAITQDVATWGLSELTRYFIISEQISPTTLYDHCNPPNIDGLYTANSEQASQGLGWDRMVLHGNFVVYNLEFWFREDVQEYVRLILSTGGHFRFRWNEQAVVAMVWQIFVPKERFKKFSFKYQHGGAHVPL